MLKDNEDIKRVNSELLAKTRDLEDKLEFKRDLIEKFEVELVQTKISVRDLNDIFSHLTRNRGRNDSLDPDDEPNLKDLESNMREMIQENKGSDVRM